MARRYRQLTWQGCVLSVLILNVAGCGLIPAQSSIYRDSPNAQREGRETAVIPSASSVLLEQGQAARAAGNYPEAASSIERALRIDPGNAVLWLELGEVRMAEGNYQQAEALARKSVSLTASDRATRAAATRLIVEALKAQGRVTEAAQVEAEARSTSLR